MDKLRGITNTQLDNLREKVANMIIRLKNNL
jgi:hypothetical protein